MPAPLAMPSIFTAASPERKVAHASLGRVSVVMMARAKSAIPCFVASLAAASSGSLARILSTGSGTPMIPVEDGTISAARTLSSRASCPANLLARSYTGFAGSAVGVARVHDHRPNSAAAGRERGAPYLERRRYHLVLGEDGGRRGAGDKLRTRARSGRPLALTPAQAAEKLNPAGR